MSGMELVYLVLVCKSEQVLEYLVQESVCLVQESRSELELEYPVQA